MRMRYAIGAIRCGMALAVLCLTSSRSEPASLGQSGVTLPVPGVLSMTPLVRLLVISHFLRQALGTQSAPTNQTRGVALAQSGDALAWRDPTGDAGAVVGNDSMRRKHDCRSSLRAR